MGGTETPLFHPPVHGANFYCSFNDYYGIECSPTHHNIQYIVSFFCQVFLSHCVLYFLLQNILYIVIKKMKYDESYNFDREVILLNLF